MNLPSKPIDEVKIKFSDKPNLRAAANGTPEQKRQALEIIGTFIKLAEEALDPQKAIRWADLPQALHPELTFSSLVPALIRAMLDVEKIDPEGFEALQVEVHPLAMLGPKINPVTGKTRYANWRSHFRLSPETPLTPETIETIIRRIMRYAKYVPIEQLAKALESNQIATYRGLGERQIELLPFLPALKYQREHFGDLHVAKFFDGTGFFDGGTIHSDYPQECPACKHGEMAQTEDYVYCLACNIGFRIEDHGTQS